MADREEVIRGLEMSYMFSNVDEDNTLVPQQIILDAIALLIAQEPVKPYGEYSEHTGTKWLTCGACNQPMVKITPNAVYPNYCPECGRAVKWE